MLSFRCYSTPLPLELDNFPILWKPTVKYLRDTLKKANLMSTLFNKSTTTISLSIGDNYNNKQKNQSFIKKFQF